MKRLLMAVILVIALFIFCGCEKEELKQPEISGSNTENCIREIQVNEIKVNEITIK